MNKFEAFQQKKAKSEKKFLIGGPLILLGIACALVLGEAGIAIGAVFGLAGLVVCIMGSSEFGKLNKEFKEQVLVDLISQFVDDGVFHPDQGLSINTVYDTEFLKRADRYHTEDYLAGSIDGVRFKSSDVKLEERHVRHTKNGTQTYYETYFLGRIFVFEFNKAFDGYLQVLEGGRPVSRRKYGKIKMESVQFNKKFKTYTTNDHSAFYILTPHFMEKLQSFEASNHGRVYFSFIDNLLYIGINNNRDTFELRMFRKIDESLLDEFKRDLLVVKDVVHELKLNNNIFKK